MIWNDPPQTPLWAAMQLVPEMKGLERHSMDLRPTEGHYLEAQPDPMSNDSKRP